MSELAATVPPMASRSVFISYCRSDREDVHDAVDLLRAGGVKVFLDVVDIDYGERWRDALAKALQRCERVMVFWSRAAAASEWVEREWRYALELGKKIVPTLLDPTPLPAELAEFQAIRRPRRTFEARSDWSVADTERPYAPGSTRPDMDALRAPRSRRSAGAWLAVVLLLVMLATAAFLMLPLPERVSLPPGLPESPGSASSPGAWVLALLIAVAVATLLRHRPWRKRPPPAAEAFVEQVFTA
jgi:hypothetical protein